MKNVFWIAGENSGDLHASIVIKELNKRNLSIRNYGIGGPRMKENGFTPLFPFNRFTVMGFVEVLKDLSFFLRIEKEIKENFENHRPDLIVLVDYPGFNFRIAKLANKMKIPVLYFISPQFWAWKQKRVHSLREHTKHVACILPFEDKLLKKFNVNSSYVGHPIAEEISYQLDRKGLALKYGLKNDKEWIGFFPGSRNIEIKKILPLYLKTIKKLQIKYPNYEYLISKAHSVNNDMFFDFIHEAKLPNVFIIDGYNYEMMKNVKFSVITSGTATLEAAYIGTPFIINYKTSPISYQIGKRIINIKRIGLPNIILDQDIVPELIQNEANADNNAKTISNYLENTDEYSKLKNKLMDIHDLLGKKSASKEVADLIEKNL